MKPGRRMDLIKAHFEGEAGSYDGSVSGAVPRYGEMLDALISAVPFPQDASLEVIDLGSGTGNLSLLLMGRYPNARITCLDLSERMLEASRAKLGDARVSYIIDDFSRSEFQFGRKYDLIMSSLALHHLEICDRKPFFGKVHSALRDGGIFLNADIILSGSETWQRLSLGKWKTHLGLTMPTADLEALYQKYLKEDRPAVLLEDIQRLRDWGFGDIDVLWKHYNFAVYGAIK